MPVENVDPAAEQKIRRLLEGFPQHSTLPKEIYAGATWSPQAKAPEELTRLGVDLQILGRAYVAGCNVTTLLYLLENKSTRKRAIQAMQLAQQKVPTAMGVHFGTHLNRQVQEILEWMRARARLSLVIGNSSPKACEPESVPFVVRSSTTSPTEAQKARLTRIRMCARKHWLEKLAQCRD